MPKISSILKEIKPTLVGNQAINPFDNFFGNGRTGDAIRSALKWAGRDISDAGLEGAKTEAERAAIEAKRKTLGVTKMDSLTSEQKRDLAQSKRSKAFIDKNFGDIDEEQFGKEHFDRYVNHMKDQRLGELQKRKDWATKSEEEKTLAKTAVDEEFANLTKGLGEGETYASRLKGIYQKDVDNINNLTPKSQISDMQLLKNTLLDNAGDLSYRRVGMIGAGIYGAANIVGSGSLGIPLISSASWNR